MVSDTLGIAIKDIDYYLTEPTFDRAYRGQFREDLEQLKTEMTRLLTILETSPTPAEKAAYREGKG